MTTFAGLRHEVTEWAWVRLRLINDTLLFDQESMEKTGRTHSIQTNNRIGGGAVGSEFRGLAWLSSSATKAEYCR